MPYNAYAQKSEFRKESAHAYVPFYGRDTGWGKVPQKLGFKPNVQVIKKSNYEDILSQIKEADYVSLDTETSSLKWDEAELISVNIGLPDNHNFVGFYYTGFFEEDKVENLTSKDDLDSLLTVLLTKPIVFMWNRYYDQQILMHCLGFKREQFWTCYDGLDLLWMMDSNVKTGLNLKQAAQDFLGLPNWGMEEDVWEDIHLVDPKQLIIYGAYDAYATLELGSQLYKIFKKHYSFMLALHLEFKNALFDYKEQHQLIDVPYVENLAVNVATMIETVKAQFYESYGVINLGSSYQKSDLLLRLGYSTGIWNKPKKDGTKVMSTKEELLQALADKGCEPALLMIRYSKLLKLQSSYITPMLNAGKSGKPIRFNFRDHDTATLRLSAGKATVKRKVYDYYLPISMQTIPKPHKVCRELNYNPETFEFEFLDEGTGQYYVETGASDMNVRSAFCAPVNGMIIKCDFAQQELVIPACLANETTWLDAIKSGKDLHNETGKMVYGRDITGDERGIIKGINFGIGYETENPEYVIANQTGWSIERSREFFIKYKAALPRLYAWKDKVMLEGRTTGSIRNLYGFERRVYSYYHTANRNMHRFGDRTCVNTSVQLLAAIMMRILMVKFWKMLYLPKGKYYGSGISFVLSLHDEMVFRTEDKSVLPQFLPDFRDTMSSVTPSNWPVKLQAEVELGKNYGQTFVVKQAENGLWLPKEEKREVVPVTITPVVTASMVDDWVAGVEDELDGFNF